MERLWKVTEATKLITIYEDKCNLASKELIKKYATILLNNPDDWNYEEYYKKVREFTNDLFNDHFKHNIINDMEILLYITEEEKEDFKEKITDKDMNYMSELYAEYKLLSKLRALNI